MKITAYELKTLADAKIKEKENERKQIAQKWVDNHEQDLITLATNGFMSIHLVLNDDQGQRIHQSIVSEIAHIYSKAGFWTTIDGPQRQFISISWEAVKL